MEKQTILERLAQVGKSVAAEVAKLDAQSARGLAYGKLVTSCRTAYRQVRDWVPRTTPVAPLDALLAEFTAAGQRGIAQSERALLAALVADVKTPPKTSKQPKQPKPKPPAVNSNNSKASSKAKGTAGDVAKATVDEVANRTKARAWGRTPLGADNLHLRGLDNIHKAVNEQMWDLTYDIPSALNEQVPNPSPVLWRFGFRKELSVWVLPQKSLDSPVIQELLSFWEAHGVKTHLVRYHPDDFQLVRDMAYDALRKEVQRVHASLIERLESASKALDAARAELDKDSEGKHTTHADYDRVEKRHDNARRAIINAAAKSLNASIDCARAFDATEAVDDLLQALQHAVRSEALAFNALASKKHIKGVSFAA
jgi:hypothetical protein